MTTNSSQLYACVNCSLVLSGDGLQGHLCTGPAKELQLGGNDQIFKLLQVPDKSSTPENKSDTLLSVYDVEHEGGRWTPEETRQLFKAYKKHVRQLLLASSNREKREIWEEVAADVKMAKRRKCNPYIARMKIENMKKTWKKHSEGLGRSHWIFQDDMAKLIAAEHAAIKEIGEIGIESVLQQMESNMADGYVTSEESESACVKKKQSANAMPPWYMHYEEQAEVRHRDKMKVFGRFIELLETIVDGDLAFDSK